MIYRSEEIAVIIRQIWSRDYFDRDELRSLHHHCPRLFIDADIDPKSLIGHGLLPKDGKAISRPPKCLHTPLRTARLFRLIIG
jgi:hypothetical protein